MHNSDQGLLKRRDLTNGKTCKLTTCVGDQISVQKKGDEIVFSCGDSKVAVPIISPLSGKEFCDVCHGLPNTIIVYYESSWPEYQSMTCAAGVVIINDGELEKLPSVRPDTWVDTCIIIPQLIIGRVETSPFGMPCGAILDVSHLNGKIEDNYIFPGKEPVILEGFATTNTAGRVHESCNASGTGATCGDVPFLYPWISPNGKRHGWALIFYRTWETLGKTRPPEKKFRTISSETGFVSVSGHQYLDKEVKKVPLAISDRYISYDPSGEDEWYDIKLGGKIARFALLPPYEGWFQISRLTLKVCAYKHMLKYRALGRLKPNCACPDEEPQLDAVSIAGWIDPDKIDMEKLGAVDSAVLRALKQEKN